MSYAGQPHSAENRTRIMARDTIGALIVRWDENDAIKARLRSIGVRGRKDLRTLMAKMTQAHRDRILAPPAAPPSAPPADAP